MQTTPLLKVAAAYIRVSDERQDEYSPDSQLKKTREYAAKEGYIIPDEYVFYDDGISAKSVKRRHEFNRMIAMAKEKEHPFEVIYVWKFSRFARNQEESMVYKNLLRKKGVSVVSVSEPIPEGHFGTLIERIIEWMDEFYLINLGTEVKRGMTEKVSRGEPVCAPAFGYIIREKKYYPHEEEADIIREIFARYADGDGMRRIAVDLGNRGIRTKRGNQPYNRWVEYILRNPVYIGKIRWSIDGARPMHSRDFDNENIMIVDGHHEPLVPIELWNKVQTRLDTEKALYPKHAKKEQPVSIMTKGLVRCSSCGGTLATSRAKSGKAQTPTVQCCNYSRGSCHVSHSVTVPRLESSIITALKQSVTERIFAVSPEKKKSLVPNAPDYDKLIAIEERRLERAKAAYLSEVDTIEQYAENKKVITARIEELTALRDKSTTPTILDLDAYADKVTQVVNIIESEKVSPEAKNTALRTIIDKIIYNKPNESISIYFRGV